MTLAILATWQVENNSCSHGMNGLQSVGFCGQVVILTEILMSFKRSFRGHSKVVWEPRKLAK